MDEDIGEMIDRIMKASGGARVGAIAEAVSIQTGRPLDEAEKLVIKYVSERMNQPYRKGGPFC